MILPTLVPKVRNRSMRPSLVLAILILLLAPVLVHLTVDHAEPEPPGIGIDDERVE
jgi:hypothetical protein